MNSPNLINYELRPAKFTERKMLLASLVNICQYYGTEFQYIGFGGVSFTDFKLFHKELHLNRMYSIEGGDELSQKRVEFNNPFSFIQLNFGISTSILPQLNLDNKSIVWLDYDDVLAVSMFDDISILFNKLPKGSIYLITCNRQLKNDETGETYMEKDFREKFNNLVPFDLNNTDFSGENNFKTIRKMLLKSINSTLKDRNRILSSTKLDFYQLFNFLYQENRGARMYSFGGIIEETGFDLENYNLDKFDFIRKDENPYRIKIPNLTLREIEYINSNIDQKQKIINSGIVEEPQFEMYKNTYKYLPNFMDVRQ